MRTSSIYYIILSYIYVSQLTRTISSIEIIEIFTQTKHEKNPYIFISKKHNFGNLRNRLAALKTSFWRRKEVCTRLTDG